jgi:UPF0755 protein
LRRYGLKFFLILLLGVLVCAGVGAYLELTPTGPAAGTADSNATYVDIAPGTGTQAMAAQLEQAGVLRSRYAFDLLRVVRGGRLVAGEYRFNHPAAAGEVYDRIVRGDVYTVAVKIPEGYNIFDIAQAVAAAGLGTREDFLRVERSETGLIVGIAPDAASLEGYLFPDTYRFTRHARPEEMVAVMVRRFRQAAGQLGLVGDAKLGRTVILASLVEKEVSQGEERPLVAGVFENRLARGIPLATDPSVIYAALLEGRYRGTIYASDLQAESAYNTYRHAGLPPGPICNPGMAALKAAMSPAKTDYLYFVADAQGHSRFSASLAEHAEQVQTYRRAIGRDAPTVAPHGRKAAKGKKRRP